MLCVEQIVCLVSSVVNIIDYRWEKLCRGRFQFPVAA
jgi:hypothetical protein